MVVVDVVVTRHGQAVQGLKKSDFTLLEDKKPQTVRIFEPHVPAEQPTTPTKIDLPPDQYTNFPVQPENRAVNLVLFDMLNTPVADQMYAREQVVEFVKKLPPGQRVALFVLRKTQLHMIAGFTNDSSELVAAANKLLPDRSALLDTEEERQQNQDLIAQIEAASGRPGAPAFDLMRQSASTNEDSRSDMRALITLAGFKALGESVAAYPGRKNVLWLSEGFPVSLAPDESLSKSPQNSMKNYLLALQETSERLSSAQMAIYPIDIRGLQSMGIAISSSGEAAVGRQGGRSRYGDLINRQSLELQRTHEAMEEIAEQTGGVASYNSNDLRAAMQRSIEHGATYYTLAYVPENKKWDGAYRHIQIKVAQPGVHAQYRQGYYAVSGRKDSLNVARNALVAAMQPTMPESTVLLLRVKVSPPDTKRPTVAIDYAVYAPDLTFTDAPDHRKHGKVEFVAVAWDKKTNQAAGSVSQTMEIALKPENYQAFLRNGLPAHQELQLKEGTYTLRLGVMDDNSTKIGTLDIPLHIGGDKRRASR